MSEPLHEPVDVDELMRRVGLEVAQRRAQRGDVPGGAVPAVIPRPCTPPAALALRESYDLADFLALEDAAFVQAAYRGVLRRGGDAQGTAHYLAEMRAGRLGKVEVLGRLRYSPEGRDRAVAVRGLLPQFAVRSLYRVPVLGYAFAWIVHLLRLPTVVRNQEGFEAYTRTHHQLLYASDTAQAEAVDAGLAALRSEAQRVQALAVQRQDLERLAGDIEAFERRLASDVDAVERLAAQHRMDQGAEIERVSAIANELRARFERTLDGIDARLGQAEQNEQAIAAAQARVNEQLGALATAQLDRTAFESQLARMDQRMEAKVDASAVAALNERLLGLANLKADRSIVDILRLEVESRLAPLAGAADVDAKLGRLERFLDQLRAGVQLANRRLERGATAVQPASPETAPPSQESHVREDFYAALEENFRGTREEIRQRAETFVEVLQRANAGTAAAPVLDLGCGRGEWLELLRDRDMVARGVDLNGIFVAQSRELGLEVAEGDALEALASLPDHSLGAVTAFHLVEHLPLGSVLRLFEQSLRVLKPGGVLILESPNPENLSVGACTFYFDPTHRNPLPPQLLEFIGRYCGFPRLELRRLSEFRFPGSLADLPEDAPEAAVLNPVIALVRQAWYGPPDYALVAHSA